MRAEGFEPTRSLEHRHLKPACLPFHHARKPVDPIAADHRYRRDVSIPRRRKYGLLVLAVVAAAGCLALGWWQLSRWESNSGSFQNLGYALQWPLFAGFCLYAYRKFIRYEEAPPEPPSASGDVTEIPAGLLPDRPAASTQHADATLREYNAYLAELADADRGADHNDQNRTTA